MQGCTPAEARRGLCRDSREFSGMAPGKKRGRNASLAAAAASAQQWNVGDLVLAKVKGFPAWPAQVSKPEAFGQTHNPTRVFVVFFGTKQIRFCHHSEISKFTEEAKALLVQKTLSKCTPADLRLAVDEILKVAEQKVSSRGDAANGKTKVGFNEMIEDSSEIRNCEDVVSANEDYETDQLVDSFDGKQPVGLVKILEGPGSEVASEIEDVDMGWGSPLSSDGISGDERGSKGIVIVEKVQTNFASHEEMEPFDSFEFFNEDDGSMPSCTSNVEAGKTEKPVKCDKSVGIWSKQGSRTLAKSRKAAASFTPAVPANICRKKRKQITTVKTSMSQAFPREVSPRRELEVSPITHDPDNNLPIVKRARARAKEVVETHEEKTALLSSPSSVELVKSPRPDEKAADVKPLSLPPKAEKYRIRSSLADNEAALPPSKRLHRALEAMTACVAEAAKEKSAEAAMAEERSKQLEEEPVKQNDDCSTRKQDFALQDKEVDSVTINLQVPQTSSLNTELADGIEDVPKISEMAAHDLKGEEVLHGVTNSEERKNEEVLHDHKTTEGDAAALENVTKDEDVPEVAPATKVSEDDQYNAGSSQDGITSISEVAEDGITATLQDQQEKVIMKVEHVFESEAPIENVVLKIEEEVKGDLEIRDQEAIEGEPVVKVEESTKVAVMSAPVQETAEDMEENRLSPVSMDMSEDTLSDLTPTQTGELQSTAECPEDCKYEHQTEATSLDAHVNADSVKADAMQEVLMGVQSDAAHLRYSPVSPALRNSTETVQRHSPKAHVQSLEAEEASKDSLTVRVETEMTSLERHLPQSNDVSTKSPNLKHSSSPTKEFASMVVKTAEAIISEVSHSVNNNIASYEETTSVVSPTTVNYTAATVEASNTIKPSPAALNNNTPRMEETSGLKVSPPAVNNNNPTAVDTKVYSPHPLQHRGETKSKSQKIVKRHSPHTSRESQSQHSTDFDNDPTSAKSRSEPTKSTSTVSRFDGEVNNIRKAYEAAKEMKQKMASDTSASRTLIESSAELNHTNQAFNEPNQAFIREPNHINDPGQPSLSAEAQAARDMFEGLLPVLSRTKESIGRATRQAIDCAKLGLSEQVIDIIARKLEMEQSYPRRIDLFFLVDSITQTSHTLRGTPAGIYRAIVQNALPRLLSSAAPPGSFARENRRQCLKVFKQWSERNIFPPSVIRHFMEEIELHNCDRVVMNMSRRPARNERPVDDPIREMEGMQVDEYGSNVSFPLPGITVPREEEESNECGKVAVDTSQTVMNKGTQAPTVERHPCILEDVDGELEMEDASPQNDTWQNQRQQYVSPSSTLCGPPLPLSTPPPLPSSPPPDVPPPPPPSLPSQGPSEGLSPSYYHHVENPSMQLPFNNYEQYNPGIYGGEDGYGYSSYEYGAHPAYGHSYQDGQPYHPDGHSYNPEGQAYPRDGQPYAQEPYHPDGQPYPQDGQPYQQDGGHLYQDGQSYFPEGHNYQENYHPDGHNYPADYHGYGGSYEAGGWSEASPRGRYPSHNPPADDSYYNPKQEPYHDRHVPSQDFYHQNGPAPPPYHYEERGGYPSGRYVPPGGYASPERDEKYHHHGRRRRDGGYSKFSW